MLPSSDFAVVFARTTRLVSLASGTTCVSVVFEDLLVLFLLDLTVDKGVGIFGESRLPDNLA